MLIISTRANAQSVQGRLLDLNENKPLRGATLSLTSLKDSSQRFNSISDSTGRFQFGALYRDSFILNVSFIGYEDFKQLVAVGGSAVNLGTLFIPRSIKQLGEVTVVSKTPPTQHSDLNKWASTVERKRQNVSRSSPRFQA